MKYSPKAAGFVQAACLALYVSVFAAAAQGFQNWLLVNGIQPSPATSIVIFLLAFIISALFCGILVFGYPFALFVAGKRRKAVATVLWSLIWLIVIAVAITVSLLFLHFI